MVSISPELQLEVLRLRAAGIRQYQIALKAGLHPSVVSALLKGAVPIATGDARVLALGRVLGVPADRCFSNESDLMGAVSQREASR
jgi:DNA-binding CsgD family transcriptional regulator